MGVKTQVQTKGWTDNRPRYKHLAHRDRVIHKGALISGILVCAMMFKEDVAQKISQNNMVRPLKFLSFFWGVHISLHGFFAESFRIFFLCILLGSADLGDSQGGAGDICDSNCACVSTGHLHTGSYSISTTALRAGYCDPILNRKPRSNKFLQATDPNFSSRIEEGSRYPTGTLDPVPLTSCMFCGFHSPCL